MSNFKCSATRDLPLDPTKIGESTAGKYTFNDAGNWRWLTAEEAGSLEAKQAVDATQTFDHDELRHDDDGFGGAVGHAAVHGTVEDNDLGRDWGKSSLGEAFAASGQPDQKDVHRVTKGKDALAEFDQVAVVAKQMIDEAIANPLGTRFALIQYAVEGTDPNTLKGGKVVGTKALHTIGEQAIIDYAVMLMEERLAKELGTYQPGPNSLEIN